MPIYDYNCSHCEKDFDMNMKIADRDNVSTIECPQCSTVGQIVRQVGAPLIGYSVSVNGGYGSRVPDGFKEVLKKIHSAPGAKKGFSSFI